MVFPPYALVWTESTNGKTHHAGREFHKRNVNGGSNVR
jgi:hypothetical protein